MRVLSISVTCVLLAVAGVSGLAHASPGDEDSAGGDSSEFDIRRAEFDSSWESAKAHAKEAIAFIRENGWPDTWTDSDTSEYDKLISSMRRSADRALSVLASMAGDPDQLADSGAYNSFLSDVGCDPEDLRGMQNGDVPGLRRVSADRAASEALAEPSDGRMRRFFELLREIPALERRLDQIPPDEKNSTNKIANDIIERKSLLRRAYRRLREDPDLRSNFIYIVESGVFDIESIVPELQADSSLIDADIIIDLQSKIQARADLMDRLYGLIRSNNNNVRDIIDLNTKVQYQIIDSSDAQYIDSINRMEGEIQSIRENIRNTKEEIEEFDINLREQTSRILHTWEDAALWIERENEKYNIHMTLEYYTVFDDTGVENFFGTRLARSNSDYMTSYGIWTAGESNANEWVPVTQQLPSDPPGTSLSAREARRFPHRIIQEQRRANEEFEELDGMVGTLQIYEKELNDPRTPTERMSELSRDILNRVFVSVQDGDSNYILSILERRGAKLKKIVYNANFHSGGITESYEPGAQELQITDEIQNTLYVRLKELVDIIDNYFYQNFEKFEQYGWKEVIDRYSLIIEEFDAKQIEIHGKLQKLFDLNYGFASDWIGRNPSIIDLAIGAQSRITLNRELIMNEGMNISAVKINYIRRMASDFYDEWKARALFELENLKLNEALLRSISDIDPIYQEFVRQDWNRSTYNVEMSKAELISLISEWPEQSYGQGALDAIRAATADLGGQDRFGDVNMERLTTGSFDNTAPLEENIEGYRDLVRDRLTEFRRSARKLRASIEERGLVEFAWRSLVDSHVQLFKSITVLFRYDSSGALWLFRESLGMPLMRDEIILPHIPSELIAGQLSPHAMHEFGYTPVSRDLLRVIEDRGALQGPLSLPTLLDVTEFPTYARPGEGPMAHSPPRPLPEDRGPIIHSYFDPEQERAQDQSHAQDHSGDQDTSNTDTPTNRETPIEIPDLEQKQRLFAFSVELNLQSSMWRKNHFGVLLQNALDRTESFSPEVSSAASMRRYAQQRSYDYEELRSYGHGDVLDERSYSEISRRTFPRLLSIVDQEFDNGSYLELLSGPSKSNSEGSEFYRSYAIEIELLPQVMNGSGNYFTYSDGLGPDIPEVTDGQYITNNAPMVVDNTLAGLPEIIESIPQQSIESGYTPTIIAIENFVENNGDIPTAPHSLAGLFNDDLLIRHGQEFFPRGVVRPHPLLPDQQDPAGIQIRFSSHADFVGYDRSVYPEWTAFRVLSDEEIPLRLVVRGVAEGIQVTVRLVRLRPVVRMSSGDTLRVVRFRGNSDLVAGADQGRVLSVGERARLTPERTRPDSQQGATGGPDDSRDAACP